ncbi:MAG TPA: sigma 54-interacting transcriptional regulator [Holophaga sp.]|nr:sigma 54-interacting transcriptional regulator [Holophaga sp.]
MVKKVALVTAFSKSAEAHARILKQLFGDEIALSCHPYDQGAVTSPLDTDLAVISIYNLYVIMCQHIPADAKTVIVKNTISNKQYAKMAGLPAGSSVLLVNNSVEMVMDTLSLFHQLGLGHLTFIPYYPGITNVPQVEIAVTPGEPDFIPSFVKRSIDIGDRVMDAKTIIEIATGLGLDHLLREERFVEYFKSIRMSPGSVTSLFDRTNILESQLSSLLDVLDDGILIIENTGLVHACNLKAREVLRREVEFTGIPAAELIPGIPFHRTLEFGEEVDYTLVKIRGRNVSVKVVPVATGEEIRGALAIVDIFEEKEKNQQRLRSQLLGKGHRSRYGFDDILTKDLRMMEIKHLARKKAMSEASVLIIGETGTGKELFAHAIHNASPRKDWQFVTVNCGALPASLLESELFGYEEGAFTGARKGGKPGLFELAHRGTLFLDEIGEMEMSLQTRLLRVLESREVMRIGGDRMINVDIRIVAATNKDVWLQMEEGGFRRDLYYRLSVLPIEIPPLRERREDILLILEHLKRAGRAEFQLAPEAEEALLGYSWPGNVRELKNLVDYLAHLDKETIEVKDLAPALRGRCPDRPPRDGVPLGSQDTAAPAPDPDACRFILGCLHANHLRRIRSGRRTLFQQALAQDLFLTETQIRRQLALMERAGLVRLSVGRGGTTITRAGIEALKRLEEG